MIHLNARLYSQIETLNVTSSSNEESNNKNNTQTTSIFTVNGKHLLNVDFENNIFENTNKLISKLSKVCF
jgi:hypothetical protein